MLKSVPTSPHRPHGTPPPAKEPERNGPSVKVHPNARTQTATRLRPTSVPRNQWQLELANGIGEALRAILQTHGCAPLSPRQSVQRYSSVQEWIARNRASSYGSIKLISDFYH